MHTHMHMRKTKFASFDASKCVNIINCDASNFDAAKCVINYHQNVFM